MLEYISIPLEIKNTGTSPCINNDKGDVEQCIDGIIDLIVFTPKGSFSADPEFGFEYWNHEFSNINIREFNNNYLGMMPDDLIVNDISRTQCEQSLQESIINYEPRLHNPQVSVELDLNTKTGPKIKSKYEMRIYISGLIDDGLGMMRQYEKHISFMVEPCAHKTVI